MLAEPRSNIPHITSSFLHGANETYILTIRATHFKRCQRWRNCRSFIFNPLSEIRTKQTIHEQQEQQNTTQQMPLADPELQTIPGRWRSSPTFTRIRFSHSYFFVRSVLWIIDNNDPVICAVYCLTHICCIDCVVFCC